MVFLKSWPILIVVRFLLVRKLLHFSTTNPSRWQCHKRERDNMLCQTMCADAMASRAHTGVCGVADPRRVGPWHVFWVDRQTLDLAHSQAKNQPDVSRRLQTASILCRLAQLKRVIAASDLQAVSERLRFLPRLPCRIFPQPCHRSISTPRRLQMARSLRLPFLHLFLLQLAIVKTDTEKNGSIQRTCTRQTLTTVHHRTCRLHVHVGSVLRYHAENTTRKNTLRIIAASVWRGSFTRSFLQLLLDIPYYAFFFQKTEAQLGSNAPGPMHKTESESTCTLAANTLSHRHFNNNWCSPFVKRRFHQIYRLRSRYQSVLRKCQTEMDYMEMKRSAQAYVTRRQLRTKTWLEPSECMKKWTLCNTERNRKRTHDTPRVQTHGTPLILVALHECTSLVFPTTSVTIHLSRPLTRTETTLSTTHYVRHVQIHKIPTNVPLRTGQHMQRRETSTITNQQQKRRRNMCQTTYKMVQQWWRVQTGNRVNSSLKSNTINNV